MDFNITKIANVIIYLIDNKVAHLNDRKLVVLLFLMDYNHLKSNDKKIFADEYIKNSRNPEPKILGEIFDIIANSEDLEDDDERLFLITELLDYIDIEIIKQKDFIELKFLKMEEEFDASLFDKEEMKTINKAIKKYSDERARKVANVTFQIDCVRETSKGEVII